MWNTLERFWRTVAIAVLVASVSATENPAVAQQTSRNIDADPLPRGGSARVDMMAGRLNKLPVSWFDRREIVLVPAGGGLRRMAFRTSGCEGDSDTGLIVTWGETVLQPSGNGTPVAKWTDFTAFDNDGNNEDNGRCSLIDTGAHSGSVAFVVYAFSMTRSTSRAKLQQKIGDGPWTTLGEDEYGGTLVRVGALQNGDFLEVQTASDGRDRLLTRTIGNDWTQMLLFQAPSPGAMRVAKAAIFDKKGDNAADRDPRIVVDSSWNSSLTTVLIGKVRRTTSIGVAPAAIRLKKGVETRIDLVHGPLNTTANRASLVCSGTSCTGTQVKLLRGRYYASLYVMTPYPLGSGGGNFADAIGADGATEGPVVFTDAGYCPHYSRGLRGNNLVFTAVLKKDGVEVSRRPVPRGLLGDGEGYNRIIMEIDADGESNFSLDVTGKADDVSFHPDGWEYTRNPQTNEIKVATWNFAHWAAEDHPQRRVAILKNAADLLGTRGDLDPSNRRVIEPANQAPWQWEADVIAFQEFFESTFPGARERLKEQTAFGWDWVNGVTELSSPGRDFFGPVFVNEFLWPVGGIKYPASLPPAAGPLGIGECPDWLPDQLKVFCAHPCGRQRDYSCHLGSFWGGVKHRFAVPLKLSAKRKIGNSQVTGTDLPVAFFNWHLYHPAVAFSERVENVERFIRAVKYLMGVPGACAFNKDCANDTKHVGNRMIIVGDTNAKNHECGEFTWFLRRLREEFGYAIDVSAATLDANDRTFDMHWSGSPITDELALGLDPQRQARMGQCNQFSGPWSKVAKSGAADCLQPGAGECGCPFKFQHRFNWKFGGEPRTWEGAGFCLNDQSPPPPDTSTASWYPWWAATFQDVSGAIGRRSGGGQRYDVVFLVGRGWANDDPVLSYKVMAHYDEASPMNGGQGGGVQMGYKGDCTGRIATKKAISYAPKFRVEPCGANPPVAGDPAIRSDHIPVGARLRVWDAPMVVPASRPPLIR